MILLGIAVSTIYYVVSSLAVRALTYCAEDPCFETHFELRVDTLRAYCPPCSELGPGGNNGEIKETRKGTGTLSHKADGPEQVSSITGTPRHTDCIWD